MAAQVEFKEHEKLLRQIAWSALKRAHAAGANTIQIDDIFGELTVAWCQARKNWEAEFNVPFGAYLVRGAWNHINRWLKYGIRQHNLAPIELDKELGDDENSMTLAEITPDKSARSAEEDLIERDIADHITNPQRWRDKAHEISPRTLQFLKFVSDPPIELVDILAGLEIRAEHARERGIAAAVPSEITRSMVFDLMGATRVERTQIKNEIDALRRKLINDENARVVPKKYWPKMPMRAGVSQ